jgi:hypothetical protein
MSESECFRIRKFNYYEGGIVMKRATIIMSIVLAGFAAPQQVFAQASTKNCTGLWVHHFSGGFGSISMQFNADGSYQMVTKDTYGRVFTDGGRYSINSGVMITQSTRDGSVSRLFFVWMSPDLVTIRILPPNCDRAVEATFARIR